MKIFVLDDDMNRIESFQNCFGEDSVDYSIDPIDAAEKLRNNEYDQIFLDHDLGGPYTRGPKGDGIDLVRVMAKEKLHIDTPIVLHSLNYAGAKNMEETLTETHNNVIRRNFFLVLKKMDNLS